MKKNKIMWCILAFVAICGVAALFAYRKRQTDGVVVKVTGQSEEPEGQTSSLPDGTEPEKTGTEQEKTGTVLYVHVCGAVVREGVYRMAEGSRVVDAITAAGGFLPEADSAYYNLAMQLLDGQKIYIPTKEETKEIKPAQRMEEAPGGMQEDTKEKKINLNTAGKEELMTLPGIGEAKAEAVLEYRKRVGAFRVVEEIKNVSGIGEALFEQIKDRISAE